MLVIGLRHLCWALQGSLRLAGLFGFVNKPVLEEGHLPLADLLLRWRQLTVQWTEGLGQQRSPVLHPERA